MSFQDDQEILEKYLDENLNTVLGLRLAERYISLDNLEGAHQTLSELLESHPHNATALFLLGEIAFKEGNNDKAKSQYEETIKIDPTFTTAYHRLIMISSDEGDNSGAADIQNLLKLLNPLDDRGTGSTDDVEAAEVTKSEFSERVLNRLDFALSESAEEAPVSDETTEEPEVETEATEPDSEDEKDAAEETSETEPETEEEISTDGEDDLATEESIEVPESTETETEETIEDSAESDIDSAVEDEAEPDSSDTGEEQESKPADESDPFGLSAGDSTDDQEDLPDETSESDNEDVSSSEDTEAAATEESEPVVKEEDDFGVSDISDEDETKSEEPSTADSEEIPAETETTDSDDSGTGATKDEAANVETETETKDEEESDGEPEATDQDAEEIETSAEAPEEEKETSESDESEPASEPQEGEAEEDAETVDTEESEETTDTKIESEPDEIAAPDSDEVSEETVTRDEPEEGLEETDSSTPNESDLSSLVVDKEARSFEMPPFSKETIAEVQKETDIELSESVDREEIAEDMTEEGAESNNVPLDSQTDEEAQEESGKEGSADKSTDEDESGEGAEKFNVPIESASPRKDAGLEPPADYESWVDKDATPESMTSGSEPPKEDKETFEGLLSETDVSDDVESTESPEEESVDEVVEEITTEKVDDVYSLTEIEDNDDEVSPLQAWFLERKSLQNNQEPEELEEDKEEEPAVLTEPKPVPFAEDVSGDSKSESNDDSEKWDKFVDTAVNKSGEESTESGKDENRGESVVSEIDTELQNLFDDVVSSDENGENEEDESANVDPPSAAGGLKLSSDLATFTLAQIYMNQGQLPEALSVLDLLDKKGEDKERVASIREEIRGKMEARNK